ncbi:activin receptor type-1-like [Morphnus guianensis]
MLFECICEVSSCGCQNCCLVQQYFVPVILNGDAYVFQKRCLTVLEYEEMTWRTASSVSEVVARCYGNLCNWKIGEKPLLPRNCWIILAPQEVARHCYCYCKTLVDVEKATLEKSGKLSGFIAPDMTSRNSSRNSALLPQT